MHQLCFILSFINQCCREFARSRDAQRRVVSGLFICCLKGSVILSFSDSGKLLFTNWSLMRKQGVLQNSSSASSSLSVCVCVWIPTHAGFLLCESWQRFTERLGFNTQRGRERENVVGVLEWLLLCPRSHFYLSISLDLYKHCFVFVFVFKKGDFYDGGITESWEWVCWVGEAAAACACFSWGCNRWWAFMSVFTHWNVASKLYWTERCKIQMYAHHQVAMVFWSFLKTFG